MNTQNGASDQAAGQTLNQARNRAANQEAMRAFGEVMPAFLNNGGKVADLAGFTVEELDALYASAYGLYEQQRYIDALPLFTFLTFSDHLEPRYWAGRGACEQVLGRFDEALHTYATLLMVKMDDPMTVFRMAECLVGKGLKKEALETLTVVKELADGEGPKEKALLRKAAAMHQFLTGALAS